MTRLITDDWQVSQEFDGYEIITFSDRIEYRYYGLKHRIDGPAVEYKNGNKYWYLNGKFHREDGPAIEEVNGYKQWFLNGKRHRIDGPACEYKLYKEWWIDGKHVQPQKNGE